MTEIEKLRKKPVEVETMLWDGSVESARSIRQRVGRRQVNVTVAGLHAETMDGEPRFMAPWDLRGGAKDARLYVDHNRSWSPLPVGYRVAKELDGSGFYPLSPEGAAAGYEPPSGISVEETDQ